MQKKVSAAVRAFGCAHKAGLALLGGGVAALGVFWAARRSAAAMQWWVEYVSMPVKRFVSALVEPLPFSFCELAATAAILICLVRLVQRIVRAMHRKQAGFAAWVLHVGTAAVWIYAGVCALWGTQYYAPSFAAQANMQAPALSVEQLAATTVWFGEQVNAAADTVPRDETGLFAVSKEKILLNTGHVYDGIVAEYPLFGRAAPQPQTGVLFQADERGRLYRLPVPPVWREHPECGLPGGVFTRHHCTRVQPPARRGGRAGSKLCGDPGFHHLW